MVTIVKCMDTLCKQNFDDSNSEIRHVGSESVCKPP